MWKLLRYASTWQIAILPRINAMILILSVIVQFCELVGTRWSVISDSNGVLGGAEKSVKVC